MGSYEKLKIIWGDSEGLKRMVEEYAKMETEKLFSNWKASFWLAYIDGCFSRNDLNHIYIMDFELTERGLANRLMATQKEMQNS